MYLRTKAIKASSSTGYWHVTHHWCCPKHTGSCTEWRQILAQ